MVGGDDGRRIAESAAQGVEVAGREVSDLGPAGPGGRQPPPNLDDGQAGAASQAVFDQVEPGEGLGWRPI
ncbi:MAG TPA: hypothetical protein VHR45_10720 [Thermoanaerobaculia bacterium]|nr:hypothetical protein [Thermoanaerobaculia bacterium]